MTTRARATHTRARATPVSPAVRELLEYHFPRLQLIRGLRLWPPSYYALGERPLTLALALEVRTRPDLLEAHRDLRDLLRDRPDDLRHCVCGRFFFADHTAQVFHDDACRRDFHRTLTKLRRQQRLARAQADWSTVRSLKTEIRHLEHHLAARVKHKMP